MSRMLSGVIEVVWVATAAIAILSFGWSIMRESQIRGRAKRLFDHGRHISMPLKRRFGRRVLLLRPPMFAFAVVADLTGHHTIAGIVFTLWNIWVTDDALFPDDDDRKKRKHEWAKIRLRMPKPIKLRPVQRWGAAPA